MPVEIDTLPDGEAVRVRASGRLTRDDYLGFVPELERTIERQGPLRLLFDMRELRGWDAGAAWEDVRFGWRHFRDFERIAMVGDRAWERWMTAAVRPFTSAHVRYFDHHDAEAAQAWVSAPPERRVFGHRHGHYRNFNKGMVAAWRLGLGGLINGRPAQTGRIMILATTGRSSGRRYRTPLNYAPGDGAVFVLSGFGGQADWMKNLAVHASCEVWLPDGGWSGLAVPVEDAAERLIRVREILQSGGRLLQRITGIDATAIDDDALRGRVEGVEVMRIDLVERVRGGPGDLAWVWPAAGCALLLGAGLWKSRPGASKQGDA